LDAPFDTPPLGVGGGRFSGTVRVGIGRKFFSDVGRKNFSGAPGNRDFSDLCLSFLGWKGRALHEFVSERWKGRALHLTPKFVEHDGKSPDSCFLDDDGNVMNLVDDDGNEPKR